MVKTNLTSLVNFPKLSSRTFVAEEKSSASFCYPHFKESHHRKVTCPLHGILGWGSLPVGASISRPSEGTEAIPPGQVAELAGSLLERV